MPTRPQERADARSASKQRADPPGPRRAAPYDRRGLRDRQSGKAPPADCQLGTRAHRHAGYRSLTRTLADFAPGSDADDAPLVLRVELAPE